jgi:hypothetical protein
MEPVRNHPRTTELITRTLAVRLSHPDTADYTTNTTLPTHVLHSKASGQVAHFYTGTWLTFTPAFTHVEEKNWDVVRRTIGYDRLQGQDACEQLDRIYDLLRIYRNCYLPAMKCIGKERFGSKVRKRFDNPTSPYRRALAVGVLTDGVRDALSAQPVATGPMTLKRQIDRELNILWDRHSLSTNHMAADTA